MSRPESSFNAEFTHRKQTIDAAIPEFATELREWAEDDDEYTQAAIESFLEILGRGGKRERGVLAMAGHGLLNGEDNQMITTVAALMEAIHAYLLVFDDVADNSNTRRGGDAGHIIMRDVLMAKNINPDLAAKTGIDMALLGALVAQHFAQAKLHDLSVGVDKKSLASKILNRRLVQTGIGQLRDIAPIPIDLLSPDDALKTALYKTAWYSILLPVEIGSALGGMQAPDLGQLKAYGKNAGLAFQLHDDVLGLIGDPDVTGKPSDSDLIEGKRTFTLLTAFERASSRQREVLRRLGTAALEYTDSEESLAIIISTDALGTTEQLAQQHTKAAEEALDILPKDWNPHEIEFMRGIALLGLNRSM